MQIAILVVLILIAGLLVSISGMLNSILEIMRERKKE